MGLETGTTVNDLVVTNPLASDPRSEGDDHIRLVKTVLKTCFPGLAGAMYRVQGKAVGYTVAVTDTQTLIQCTAAITLSSVAAATAGNGFAFAILADGFDVVFDPNGAELVNGAATVTIGAGDYALVRCTGTAWLLESMGSKIHAAASKTTPVDADESGWWDSVAGKFVKVTFTNLKATLKTYFDTLYTSLAAVIATANSWTKAQRGTPVGLTDGATITPDFSLANNFQCQLGGSRTLANPTNIVEGQSGIIRWIQDATGSRTLAYGWMYSAAGGVLPVLSTAAGAHDEMAYNTSHYATVAVTISIATPGVVSWTGHGCMEGDKIQFSTTGALPTGLVAATTYYIKYVDANSFQLAATRGGAAIATSGSQSGVHTAVSCEISLSLRSNIS